MKIVLTRPLLLAGALLIALGCSSDRSLPTDLSTGGDNSTPTGTVPAGAPANVAITPSPVPQLAIGDSVVLSSLVTTSTGQQLNPALLWTSSDTAVATVNPLGVVLARTPGTAVVRGTVIASASSTVTGSVAITVLAAATADSTHTASVVASVKSIVVSFGNSTVGTAGTVQAFPLLKDSLGRVLTGRTVTWTSGTPSVATVDPTTGLITGIAAGTSMIIATSGTVTGSAPMTVTSTTVPVASVKAVTVALSSASILTAGTSQATATLKDSLGQVLTGRAITWTSSAASVATINAATGVVTGVAPGTSVVTAASGSISGSTTITVTAPPVVVAPVKTITVVLSGSSIAPAATAQATATLKDSLGKVLTGRTVTWTSTSPTTATVHATMGVVTGIAAGTTTITATSGSVTGSATITVVAAAPPPPAGTIGAQRATGPTTWMKSAYVAPLATAHVYHVLAGQNLQARIDSAQPGDVVLIQAGATFQGPFTLRPKAGGSAVITIRSDAADASLPLAGTRMAPSYAPLLPKLVAGTAYNLVVTTAPRAANYRLMFLEVAPMPGNDINTLVRLGSGNSDQPVVDSMPSNIVLDRVYLHGLQTNSLVRAVQMHGAALAVVDSYLSEIHANGQDSQAIVSYNGSGPYKINNNFLSAAGENVMFGGSTPMIPGMISSDIEMRGNHVFKDPAWLNSVWNVKNHLEFKAAQRVLIEGNLFENNWIAAQSGVSILIKSSYQTGWNGAVSRDIILRSNRIRNVTSGISIAARPDGPAIPANLIWVVNNLFEQLSPGTTSGIGVRLNADLRNIVIEHNTLTFSPGMGTTTLQFDRGSAPLPDSIAVLNNVLAKAGGYGVLGLDGGGGEGAPSLTTYHATFFGNVMNGVTAPPYPATGGNGYPSSIGLVYSGWQTFNYSIAPALRNAGTDGKDPGADIAAVLAATAGAP